MFAFDFFKLNAMKFGCFEFDVLKQRVSIYNSILDSEKCGFEQIVDLNI